MTRARVLGRGEIVTRLAAGGFVAPEEEADELLACEAPGRDVGALLERRLTGEPLEWITGRVAFGGLVLAVAPGVYVPRWHTELLAARAVARLPEDGVAIDVATGCGALAAVLGARRPAARVLASDIAPEAVACARANGVDARLGDLFEPLRAAVAAGTVDVVCGTVPYVPTDELGQLHRDTFTFETPLAYDGGAGGLELLVRVVREAAALLRPGGALVLGLAGGQPAALDLHAYDDVRELVDEDGLVRGIEATLAGAGDVRREPS